MEIARSPLDRQIQAVEAILSQNATFITVLKGAASLGLPNWYLAGGALSQTIWNHVSGLPLETGIRDYDLVYFDDTDLSYEAEDRVIQAAKHVFADLPVQVEIRNQARVHLWFGQKFGGLSCPPNTSVEGGIDTWISTSAMIGVRLRDDGEWSIYAPRGLSEFFSMVVRPNTAIGPEEVYVAKVRRWKAIWPALTVVPWPAPQMHQRIEHVQIG